MRLQIHATDPDLLDGDYDIALQNGKSLWVLSPQRLAMPWSGRYLVPIDTDRQTRPAWATVPMRP